MSVAPAFRFLDWPVVTDPAAWDAAVALVGLPHSEPYPHDERPNDQTRAPSAIRQHSWQYGDPRRQWDFDLGGELAHVVEGRCIDIGDMPWTEGSYDDHAARVTAAIAQLWRAGTQVLVLGGDHGVTIPVLDALEAVGKPVHVVQVDAHLDWREAVDGIRRGYSSPLRWASRLPWVRGLTQIGLRGTGSARREEAEAARAYGAHLFTAREMHETGLAPALATVPPGVPVYVTIDADGLDPGTMPGVMWPAPGGLRFEQVESLLYGLARGRRIVGMDLVEVAPSNDLANHLTCLTACRLMLTLLGACRQAGRG
jgi:agmatinase